MPAAAAPRAMNNINVSLTLVLTTTIQPLPLAELKLRRYHHIEICHQVISLLFSTSQLYRRTDRQILCKLKPGTLKFCIIYSILMSSILLHHSPSIRFDSACSVWVSSTPRGAQHHQLCPQLQNNRHYILELETNLCEV